MGNDDAAFGMEEGDEDAEGEVVEEQALPPPPRFVYITSRFLPLFSSTHKMI